MTPELNQTLLLLESYIDLGFPIVALWGLDAKGRCLCGKDCGRNAGKHPHNVSPNGVNSATLDKVLLRSWVQSNRRGNWGVRCGATLGDGRYLVVVDVDPRNGGEATLAQLQALRGVFPETIVEDTGGGGAHYLFATKEPVGSYTAGPGVDILGVGKYFVVSPSRHVSGDSYGWRLGTAPGDIPIANAPPWIAEGSGGVTVRPVRVGEETARDTVLGEVFALAGKLGPVFPGGQIAVVCPWVHEHSDGRGNGRDSSTVILPPAGGSKFGGFKCQHSHCQGRKWPDVIQALPPELVAAAQKKYPMLRQVDPSEVPGAASSDGELSDYDQKIDACKKALSFKPSKTGNGFKIINDQVNLTTILKMDPRWENILKFDEFSQTVKFNNTPPWHEDDAPRFQQENWSDTDTARLDSWCRRFYNLELSAEAILRTVYVTAQRNAFNPLRGWLDTLQWDGTRRLDTWLSRYLGVEENLYSSSVGTKWMISAIARAYKPGCKADHLLILEGPQGRGKSAALRCLVGERWFSDTAIDLGNKDSFQALRGKWVIELQELSSLKRADSDRAKAFFTSPTDRYRPPYGREMVEIPRSTVFCGSVNHDVYLQDETGNRRYWPVRVGTIDMMGLAADRDQLWAEAKVRFQDGDTWWPSFEETSVFEGEQEARAIGDPWELEVARFLTSEKAGVLYSRHSWVSLDDILTLALGLSAKDKTPLEARRVSAIMRALKWEKTRRRGSVDRNYGFTPTAQAVVKPRVGL